MAAALAVALRNAWRFAYQIPLADAVAGRAARAHRGLHPARDPVGLDATGRMWDDAAALSYEAVLRQPRRHADEPPDVPDVPVRRDGRERGRALRRARGCAMPARLLIGEHDPLGAALAAGFERHGDDAAYEVVPGAGHFLPEERPAVVAERRAGSCSPGL